MRLFYYIFHSILLFSLLQGVKLSPFFHLTYNHDSGIYRELDTPISSMKLGTIINYHKEKLIFNSHMLNLFPEIQPIRVAITEGEVGAR